MYLFFSDVPHVGYHRVNSGGLLQRNWRKQVFAWGLVLSSHADGKCSALSKYRCWVISYQLFQQFRTFFSYQYLKACPFLPHALWQERLLLHSNTLQGIMMHSFMSFKLHVLELCSTFGVIKRGKSFHKSSLFASLGVTSSNGTGLRVRKCWGIYFIRGNKHSLLLSGYSILMHCGVIAKDTQRRCDYDITFADVFNHACVAARRPSGPRRGGRCTAQRKMPMDAASARWWHPNRTSAPGTPKAASFASSWRK